MAGAERTRASRRLIWPRQTECVVELGTATKLAAALPRGQFGHGEAVEDQIDRLGNRVADGFQAFTHLAGPAGIALRGVALGIDDTFGARDAWHVEHEGCEVLASAHGQTGVRI